MKISIIYWTKSIRCMTNTKGGIKMSKFKENDEVWIENDLGLVQCFFDNHILFSSIFL